MWGVAVQPGHKAGRKGLKPPLGKSYKNQQQMNPGLQMQCLDLFFYNVSFKVACILQSFDFDLQMKYNLPSWCDRVLWKSYPLVHVVCQSYGEWQVERFDCPKLKDSSLSVCKMGELPATPVR